MKESGKKVRNTRSKKTRKIRNINIGIIVVFLVFVYMIVTVVVGISKKHLSIYEVQAVSMSQNNSATALIVRNEQNCYAESSGYTNFYVRNGSRVAVGDSVYSIDQNKNLYDYVGGSESGFKFSDSDVTSMKNYISTFNDEYSDDNFASVYTLKESLDAEMLNISDSFLMDNLDTLLGDASESVSINVKKSDKAGIISFFSDSLDGITADKVSADTFDKTNYSSRSLYNSDIKGNGDLIYKLVDDAYWSLVIKLDEEQYRKLSEKGGLSFTVKKDDLKISSNATFYELNGSYFCRVDLIDYMIRYIKDRFLEIDIDMDSDSGLKIPYSSIVEKDFYVIPSKYYTKYQGEEGTIYGFTYMIYDEATNVTSYQFVEKECYYEDKENDVVYVSAKDMEYGQYVYCMEDETLYQVSVVKKMKGAYNVNDGYAVFRRIEIITESDDYCIIKSEADRSLSEHDHIALHADLIDENLQIY